MPAVQGNEQSLRRAGEPDGSISVRTVCRGRVSRGPASREWERRDTMWHGLLGLVSSSPAPRCCPDGLPCWRNMAAYRETGTREPTDREIQDATVLHRGIRRKRPLRKRWSVACRGTRVTEGLRRHGTGSHGVGGDGGIPEEPRPSGITQLSEASWARSPRRSPRHE